MNDHLHTCALSVTRLRLLYCLILQLSHTCVITNLHWLCCNLLLPFHIELFQHTNSVFDSTMWHFELTATIYINNHNQILCLGDWNKKRIWFWFDLWFWTKFKMHLEVNIIYININIIISNSRCQFEVSHSAVKSWIYMLKKFDVKRHLKIGLKHTKSANLTKPLFWQADNSINRGE